MDIRIDKEKRLVEWYEEGKKLQIYNKNVLYAFGHGKGMLLIKEKYSDTTGFSAYDNRGNLIFSYKYLGNSIIFCDKNISIQDGRIITADYGEDKEKLIVLKETGETRVLVIYDKDERGNVEIRSPQGYKFVSLKNDCGNLMVVAQGMSELTKDAYGRNDWCFSIDLDNNIVQKERIIQ